MKKDFYYPSKDGVTKIHAIEWKPAGEIKAALQICHGMVEYIKRYDEFAEFLVSQGYYVVGHDHLGHGESVRSDEFHGFFAEGHGNEYVIGDIRELYKKTKVRYSDIPYFLLGHSMGSFLVRQYIKKYGKGLTGVIIMGTGHQPAALVAAGKALCSLTAKQKGWQYRSKIVDDMAFAGFNKKFEPARTTMDWLSKDTEKVDAYLKDPWCTFRFTVNAYYHMFCGMQELAKPKNLNNIPKELPVLFIAGKDDPVGEFGKAVEKVYNKYLSAGIRDVSIKLCIGDRHEILNETDRQQVYEYIYKWMKKRIG